MLINLLIRCCISIEIILIIFTLTGCADSGVNASIKAPDKKPISIKKSTDGEEETRLDNHNADRLNGASVEDVIIKTEVNETKTVFNDAERATDDSTDVNAITANAANTAFNNTGRAQDGTPNIVDDTVKETNTVVSDVRRTLDIFSVASMLFENIQSYENGTRLRNEKLTMNDLITIITTELEKCPFRPMCHFGSFENISFNSLDSKGDGSFCCLHCSCSLDCGLANKCCPDFPEAWFHAKNKTSLHADPYFELDAFETEKEIDNATECTNNIIDTEYKHTMGSSKLKEWVSTCPEGYHTETFVLCESNYNASDEPQFHQLVPLGSAEWISIIYKNKYCAICNNVDLTLVEPFHPIMTCLELDDLIFIINNIKYPHTYDEFLSSQEDDNESRDRLECKLLNLEAYGMRFISHNADPNCNIINIDRCNVTGRWDGSQHFLSRACAGYVLPVYTTSYGFYIYYANVFCKMCNPEPDFGLSKRECGAPQPQWATTPTIYFNIEPVVMYHLDDEPVQNDILMSVECKTGYIFDIHENKCRRMICPFTFYPGILKCEPVFDKIFQLPFYLSFKVKLKNILVSTSSENLIAITTNTIMKIFKEKLRSMESIIPDHDIYLCGSRAWFSEKSIIVDGSAIFIFDEFVINIYANFYDYTPAQLVYTELLNTTKETIAAANKHFSVQSKFIGKVTINDAHSHDEKMKESKLNKDVLAVCRDGLQIWKQMYCDRILLDKYGFEKRNGHSLNKLYPYLKNKYLSYNENKIAVCLDDYVLAAQTFSSNSQNGAEIIFLNYGK